jgi:hypothetical protein
MRRLGSKPTARLALFAALWIPLHGCGYRPPRATIPSGARSIRVAPPDASRGAEAQLAGLLAVELVRQLARNGVRSSTAGHAEAVLKSRVISLSTMDSILAPSARELAARTLRLEAEFLLEDADRKTIWRSGHVEVRTTWPLAADLSAAEAARRRALGELAAQGAEQAIQLLLSGF